MKAKYLLRGLGLGMIITAVVMGAYTRSAVADARVAVLKEYGIGEEATLAETLVDVGGNKDSDGENDAGEPDAPAVTEPAAEESAEPETQTAPDAAEAAGHDILDNVPDDVSDAVLDDDLAGQQGAGAAVQNGTVTIEISRGDDSGTVARKLFNAGLVESAAEYDAFLMQHGYDKKLSTGVKTIDITDSWQDIAEKLAGN